MTMWSGGQALNACFAVADEKKIRLKCDTGMDRNLIPWSLDQGQALGNGNPKQFNKRVSTALDLAIKNELDNVFIGYMKHNAKMNS